MKLLLCCVSFILVSQAFAQQKTYYVRPSDSRIGFVVTKWLVFREEGRFKRYEGTITTDPRNPASTTVSLTIQTASVDSRDSDRDNVIRSRDMLDVQAHPVMRFTSESVLKGNKDTLLVTGNLTIRDITKKITVPIRFLGAHSSRGSGDIVGYEGEFTIDRNEFGVSGFSHMVGQDVTIQLQIGAVAR